jgi:hypothetical protein
MSGKKVNQLLIRVMWEEIGATKAKEEQKHEEREIYGP